MIKSLAEITGEVPWKRIYSLKRTASLPLKIGRAPKGVFIFQPLVFRGGLLVSGRVYCRRSHDKPSATQQQAGTNMELGNRLRQQNMFRCNSIFTTMKKTETDGCRVPWLKDSMVDLKHLSFSDWLASVSGSSVDLQQYLPTIQDSYDTVSQILVLWFGKNGWWLRLLFFSRWIKRVTRKINKKKCTLW